MVLQRGPDADADRTGITYSGFVWIFLFRGKLLMAGFLALGPKVLWLLFFVALYWTYCIFWGIRGALSAKTASDYFIAGRKMPLLVFVLATTVTSFAGWMFVGHPGLLTADGFPYAFAAFAAIAIPFTGVLFLKRQWMLGKRFGFVTPGEMLSEYFRGDLIRLLVVVVAIVFAIPFLGIQIRASGILLDLISGGLFKPVEQMTGGLISSTDVGMWLLSAVVFIYVALGGLRAVAYIDALQALVLTVGVIVIGVIAVQYFAGIGDLKQSLAAVTEIDSKRTPDGYSHFIAIPGVMQLVSEGPAAIGGAWTGMMILTFMLALMGIQASPGFTMWGFASGNARSFAPQQVWASAFIMGIILLVVSVIQGFGGHFLGLDSAMNVKYPELVNNVLGPVLQSNSGGAEIAHIMREKDILVPLLIGLAADIAPWLFGFLAVCALAVLQSTGTAYMSTTSGMLARDVIRRFIIPTASHARQKRWARICVLAIIAAALAVAISDSNALFVLGGLALAFGFQMWPALIAVCYVPWFTRAGVTIGLALGLIGVLLTESVGAQLAGLFGYELPWGRWPLTMHSAFWGMSVNLLAVIVISALTQKREDYRHKMRFHNFIREFGSLPNDKRGLIPLGWILVLLWLFFAIGPGAVIGNTAFGDPNMPSSWWFGWPPIWTWQIVWWGFGVLMIWYLAYKLEMSTGPRRGIDALVDDIGDLGGGDRSSV